VKGDILSLNCFPMIAGYYTALERTLFVDHVSDEHRKIWDVNCEAHRRGLEILRPGKRCGDIAEPARLDPGVELGRDVENAHRGQTMASKGAMQMDMLTRIRGQMLPFAELLGIEFVSASPDKIVAEMIVREDLCTHPAVLHGGAVMAFADTLGATGTIVNLPEGAGTTTIESKTNFVAPAPAGTRVVGEATPVHLGRRTMIWQTRVSTPEGRLVALVTQTQLVL